MTRFGVQLPNFSGFDPSDLFEHVADLSTRQKTALRAEIGKMLNDIRFLRMLTDEARARGPWSQAAVDHSEGTLPPI